MAVRKEKLIGDGKISTFFSETELKRCKLLRKFLYLINWVNSPPLWVGFCLSFCFRISGPPVGRGSPSVIPRMLASGIGWTGRDSLLWLSVVFLPALAWATEIREYPCYRFVSEPSIDGKLDDAVWKTVPSCHGFLVLGKDCVSIPWQTSFRMGWTDKALFIAVDCADPKPSKLTANEADGGAVWRDDSVELFLFPTHQSTYKQFVVNAGGSRGNSGGKLLDWSAKTAINERGWTCEMRIPFGVFQDIPKDGEKWRLNVARNILTGTERYSCWVRSIQRSFHETDGFGSLIFKGKTPSPSEAAVLGQHLRLEAYYQSQIKELARVRSEYKEFIEQGMQFKELQKEIREIQQGWKTAEEMVARENPSLQAVSGCWEQSRILEERTRKLPLRVDMEKLFKE